ncbi:MAG: hypothetical protein Q7N50_15325 [Armatimonadota bacterium]|nr:hypothetical protein [Armatimonadota bacterium]
MDNLGERYSVRQCFCDFTGKGWGDEERKKKNQPQDGCWVMGVG